MAVIPLNGRTLCTGEITQATIINGVGHVEFTVIDDSGSTRFVLGDVIYVAEPNYIDANLFDGTIAPNTQYVMEDAHAVVQRI